jgi:molecular chaperone GrpE
MAEKQRTPDPVEAIPETTGEPATPSEAGTTGQGVAANACCCEADEAEQADDVDGDPSGSVSLAEDPLLAQLAAQLADTEARLRAVSAAYREIQGEMVSFRQRNERLQEERDRLRRGEVVTGIFEPVQNLKRSLAAIAAMGLPEEVPEGLRMIVNQFMAALKKLGLEEIAGLGEPFDPSIHEALAVVPVTDAAQEGIVLQVYESGWRIGPQVIQPARVIIGAYHEPEA